MVRIDIDLEKYYKFTPFGIALDIFWFVCLSCLMSKPAVSGIVWVSLGILVLRTLSIVMKYKLWKKKIPRTLKNIERFFYVDMTEAILVIILFGYYGRFFETQSRVFDFIVCFILAFSIYVKTKFLDNLKEEQQQL